MSWLLEPGRALLVGLACWALWCWRWQHRVNRSDQLDIDLRLAWRIWHWFSGGEFVPWRSRRWPALAAWTLESGRALPCVDVPSIELVDPDGPGPEPEVAVAVSDRPLILGCRQRRLAIAAARTAGTVAVVVGEYVRAGAPLGSGATALALAGLGGTAAVFGAPVAVAFAAVRRAIYVHVEEPIAEAVRKRAGHSRPDSKPRVPVRRICRVRRGEQYNLDITVHVDRGFEPGDEESKSGNMAHLWNDVATVHGFDIGKVEPDWSGLEGRRRHVTFRAIDQLPDSVLFNVGRKLVRATVEVLEHVARDGAYVLGLGAGSVPYAPKIDTESPHLMFSAATGKGKSVWLKIVCAQALWHGAELYVLDYKRVSHRWVNGPDGLLGGVKAYCRDIEVIHNQCLELAAIAMARYAECDPLHADHDLPDYQRIVILIDEIPEMLKMLRAWWRATGHKDSCPSADALESILNMGRAVKVHIIGGWQRGEARHVPGGSAGRENFGVKIVVGANKDTFNVIAKGAEFVPPNNRDGWAVAVQGFETTELQRILADDDRDGNMAVYRWVGAKRGYCRQHGAVRTNGQRPEPEYVAPTPEPETIDDDGTDRGIITYRQWCDEEPKPYQKWASAETARKRARRTNSFPDPAPGFEGDVKAGIPAKHFRGDLRLWFANLPANRGSTDEPDPLIYVGIKGGPKVHAQVLRGELPGIQMKVGFTFRPVGERMRELGLRTEDVFRVIRVPMPARGKRLPDKDYHDDLHSVSCDPDDDDNEIFWCRDKGLQWLRELERGEHGAEVWRPRTKVAA